MTFANWWQQQPESEDYHPVVEGELMAIASSSEELVTVDTVRRDFDSIMHSKGADPAGVIRANRALEREILDSSSYELARELNPQLPRGVVLTHRALPKPAQEGLTAGRIRARYDLEGTEITAEDQAEKNQQIEDSVRQSGRETRKWLPW
jgi:hypothetical protein